MSREAVFARERCLRRALGDGALVLPRARWAAAASSGRGHGRPCGGGRPNRLRSRARRFRTTGHASQWLGRLFGNPPLQARCELSRVLEARGRQNDHELIPSDPAGHARGANSLPDAIGEALQGAVANRVPKLIVGPFEVVHVEQDEGQTGALVVSAPDLAVNRFHQRATVWEASQPVQLFGVSRQGWWWRPSARGSWRDSASQRCES